jgi:hypothetical protein
MVLDNEGFLWFVTNQGIWRFDGSSVEPVDIQNPALRQKAVPDDIYRYHSMLVFSVPDISAESYRLLYYDIYKRSLGQSKLPGRPFDFLIDKTGALNFLTSDGSNWNFTEKEGLKQIDMLYTYRGWVNGEEMENAVKDSNGDIYIFSHKKVGVVRKQVVTWAKVTETDKKFVYVRRAYCTPKYIDVIYNNGLVVYQKKDLKRVFEYLGTKYELSLPSKNSLLPVSRPIKDSRVQCMFNEPGTRKVLVGTDEGLLEIEPDQAAPDEIDKQQLVVDFFKNKSVRAIYRSPDGKLYIGTYQGFFVYDGYSFKKICPYIAYTIQPVNKDSLLAGLEGGQGFYLLDTRTDKGRLNSNADHNLGTTKIIAYKKGHLAGAGNIINILTHLSNGCYKVLPFINAPHLGIVKDMTFIKGRLWVAFTSGIFKECKNSSLQKIYPKGRDLACYSMFKDNSDIWVGTNGEGLVKIDTNGKKLKDIHFNDGLAGEYVYSLLNFNKLIIAGTNGGVSIFDRSSGMQPLPLPDLPPSDGLIYQEFNHSAIFNDTGKHKIILGGTQGLTFLDADYLNTAGWRANDQIRLSYIKKGYNTMQPTSMDIFVAHESVIKVLPENNFTGIKFSGPLNQQNVLFRIKEIDSKWHQAKLSDEVSLFAIPPGKYTLEARFPSVTNPRCWLHESLIVVPPYYETWVFKVFLLILVIFIVYLAWRYNANKIRQEQQMRTIIASDLHDEIGSTLTRISINSELFSMREHADKSVLEKISDDSKKALSSISDIIWSIDSRNDNNEDLMSRMKDHAHKMLEDIAHVHYRFEGLANAVNIPQTLRQNLYLIYKEAVNNIVRHNYEPSVWIRLQNSSNGFVMEIKNTIQRKQPGGYKGQGLKNMQMRAKRINATIEIFEDDEIFSVILKMKELK